MKDPVTATLVTEETIYDCAIDGAFVFDGDFVHYVCPCGCKELMALPVKVGPKQDGAWEWDGNSDVPTLSPSIKRLDKCRFHGYLTKGIWTFCGDSGS